MTPTSGLFPLPLVPLEQYLLADDRPTHPMVISVELHFDRTPDIPTLEQCVGETIVDHPLLGCRIDLRDDGPAWIAPTGQTTTAVPVDNRPLIEPSTGRLRGIDLQQDIALRHQVQTAADGSGKWTLQVHHAACDGVGLRQFLLDALCRYATAKDCPPTKQLPRPYRATLSARGDYDKWFRTVPTEPMSTWQKIRAAHYFHFQPPAPLQPPSTDSSRGHHAAELLLHRRLDADQSQRVLSTVAKRGQTLDDVTIAAAFRTCADLLRKHGGKDSSRLRILTPIDLRRGKDRRLPACNRMTFGFLGRTLHQTRDEQLASSIRDEKDWMRRSLVHLDFLGSLPLAVSYPWLLRRLLNRRSSMATMVVTTTGDILRGTSTWFPRALAGVQFGDVHLRSVHAAAPTRPGTPITLSMTQTDGRISATLNWDRTRWSADQADRWLKQFQFHFLSFE